jgi:glycosyltransferase involved in cell wall biosynthesis
MRSLKNDEISLIVTTYNSPERLDLYLCSVKKLRVLPKELLVADDGSAEETAELIRRHQSSFPIPLIHVWQEDCGFRAAKIRNEALKASSGRYIIFTDGDIILHPAFVADHLQMAREGFFVQGSRILLSERGTAGVLESGSVSLHLFSAGINSRWKAISCLFLRKLFSQASSRLKGIRTCNFALWRNDAFRVNGFNEEFEGWGREDTEFALRLLHSGIKRLNLRFGAIIFHLHHPENDRSALPENDLILEKTSREKLRYCVKGLTRADLNPKE